MQAQVNILCMVKSPSTMNPLIDGSVVLLLIVFSFHVVIILNVLISVKLLDSL